MINYPPRGLILELVTPLNTEGKPDRESLGWLIQRLKRDAGAVLAGSLEVGEALKLDPEARIEILEASLIALKNGPALFFEITSRDEHGTLEILDLSESLLAGFKSGPELYYFLTPLVYHSNRNLPDHLEELGRKTGRQIILSNNPGLVSKLTGAFRHENIRTSVLKKISMNEQIVGLEYSGGVDRAINYQRALRGRAKFRLYDGDEESFISQPSSSGLVSCGANLLPGAWADIVNSSLDIFESKRMYPDHLSQIWQNGRKVRQLLSLYASNPPGYIKKALELLTLIPRAKMSDPAEELGPDEVGRLITALKRLEML
jgi:dihydrodipicolinate synthase/N-acetylneuraminate lyase